MRARLYNTLVKILSFLYGYFEIIIKNLKCSQFTIQYVKWSNVHINRYLAYKMDNGILGHTVHIVLFDNTAVWYTVVLLDGFWKLAKLYYISTVQWGTRGGGGLSMGSTLPSPHPLQQMTISKINLNIMQITIFTV